MVSKEKEARGIKCTVNWFTCNLTLVPGWGKCLVLTFPLQSAFVGSTLIPMMSLRFQFAKMGIAFSNWLWTMFLHFWTCGNPPARKLIFWDHINLKIICVIRIPSSTTHYSFLLCGPHLDNKIGTVSAIFGTQLTNTMAFLPYSIRQLAGLSASAFCDKSGTGLCLHQ